MLSRQERSWVLYDVGNSAYSLIVVTVMFPLYFKGTIAATLPPADATAYWGYANAGAALVLALISPLLGPLADMRGMKKPLFALFFLIGVLATVLLALPLEGAWLWAIAIFVLSRIGWGGSSLFYDSFLVDVAAPGRMHDVSSRGYAYGYIGGTVPFIAIIVWLFASGGEGIPSHIARAGFILSALWWALFTIPMLHHVGQRYARPRSTRPLRRSLEQLLRTLRTARRRRDAFLFLIAYFFYIDGVDTIIAMAAAYGVDAGLGAGTLVGAILMIQIVAFPCAILYGRYATRYSARPLILTAIGVYLGITLIAFFLPDVASPAGRAALFWTLSFLVATSMGGVQALSRSLFARLIPSDRSAEFFGLFNIMGRFAAIMGPFLMGVVASMTGHSRWGIIPIAFLFLIGAAFLLSVREPTIPGTSVE